MAPSSPALATVQPLQPEPPPETTTVIAAPKTILRPTEAQLRWAQFHRHRVASAVQDRVAQLWLQPALVQDVPGALLPDDGNSSNADESIGSNSNSDDNSSSDNFMKIVNPPRQNQPPRSRPQISRGRRALLHVSKRAYEVRRLAIVERGFRRRGSDDDSNNSDNDDADSNASDDFLDAIFSERSLLRRNKRRKRGGGSTRRYFNTVEDEERVKRFEAAFYAMMSTLTHPFDPNQSGSSSDRNASTRIVATKIWTRPDGVAVNVSIDGREYSDWRELGSRQKRFPPAASKHPLTMPSSDHLNATFDKSASWLVHLPPKERKFTDSFRQHLTVMARQYLVEQQHGNEGGDDDVEDNVDDDDVQTLVDHFERYATTDAEEEEDMSELNTRGNPMVDLIARFEQQNSHHVVQVVSPTTADLIRRFENPVVDKEGFVNRFVAQIEAAVAAANTVEERLVTADGKLHKPAFARLVRQYLTCQVESKQHWYGRKKHSFSAGTAVSKPSPWEATSGTMAQEQKDKDALDGPVDEQLPSFVRIFIEQMAMDDQAEPVLTVDGTVNRPVLERMVHRYLEETSNRCIHMEDTDETETKEAEPSVPHLHELSQATESVHNKPTLFGRIQNVTATIQSFRRRGDEPSAGHFAESKVEVDPQPKDSSHQATDGFGAKLTGSVSNKVSELFSSLNSRNATSDEAAYSAFRLAQDQRRHAFVVGVDDESSQSSFQILPAGIRKVVQGFRDRRLFSPQDDDSCGEHKEDSVDYYSQDGDDATASEGNASEKLSSLEGHQSAPVGISPDDVKSLQAALMSGDGHHSDQSVIYADGSLVSENDGVQAQLVSSLMLSPTLITKRHQQAIRAVESRKWDHVKYLLSANPWLAEMADVNTNQYVIHKVAFYGAGLLGMDHTTGEVISMRYPPTPEQLNIDLIRLFSSSVHKFDRDGNLPLHMAAASANLAMIKLLGERFPGGASVRNEDGMLPLHLVIIACASPVAVTFGSDVEPTDIVRTVTGYFPGALGVVDNEGNLPIHTAASVLQGEAGAAIVNFLLDETERQIYGPLGLRFCNRRRMEEIDDAAFETETIVTQTDSLSPQDDEHTNCLLIRNEMGQTPLFLAISSRAGWEVVEALTCTSGCLQALDSENNSALHILLAERYQDPIAAMSVVRLVPEAATLRNDSGMLPIEIACIQMLPREVILALALVDLPINLDRKHDASFKEGFGASWCYLSCECDDFYVDIVEELVRLCSFTQARSLCLFQSDSKEIVLARATPKCRNILLRALRVIGRFEFLDSVPIYSETDLDVAAFNALDFGTPSDASPDGRRVLLRCYTSEDNFLHKTIVLSRLTVDASLFEEILTFVVGERDTDRGPLPDDGKVRYCISIERPELTLSSVVRGMLGNLNCQNDASVRHRYTVKVFSVLRSIAKSLQRLHSDGFVHGNLSLENCGKYSDKWKLSDILEAQAIGETFDRERLSISAPPEAVLLQRGTGKTPGASFRTDLVALPSFDSWGFGKLAYEVLVGDTFLEFDVAKDIADDEVTLVRLCQWNEFNMQECRRQLELVGVTDEGVALVLQCIGPEECRPTMDEVLRHSIWSGLRRLQ